MSFPGGPLWRELLKADPSNFLIMHVWGRWLWPSNTCLMPDTMGPRGINILKERALKGILLIPLFGFLFNNLSLIFTVPQIREVSSFPLKCLQRLLPLHQQQVPCKVRIKCLLGLHG